MLYLHMHRMSWNTYIHLRLLPMKKAFIIGGLATIAMGILLGLPGEWEVGSKAENEGSIHP